MKFYLETDPTPSRHRWWVRLLVLFAIVALIAGAVIVSVSVGS
ncbi:hypothetical protein [Microbacterium sp. P5_E9]